MPRESLICLMLLVPFLLADCSGGKKAGRRHSIEEQSSEDEEGGASRRGRGGPAGDEEDAKDVEVEVEAQQEFQYEEPEPEVQVETVNAPRPKTVAQPEAQNLIALKITVKNHLDNLQMLVAPQRFYLETEGGAKIRPTFRELEGPMLREGYLKDGDKVTGWVVFNSPANKDKLYLVADLRNPPIRVPVDLGKD